MLTYPYARTYIVYVYDIRTNGVWGGGGGGRVIIYVNTVAGGRGVRTAHTRCTLLYLYTYIYTQALLNACVYTHNPQAALRVTYLFNARARISFGPLSRTRVPVPPPCESRAAVRRGRKYFKNSCRTPKNRPLQLRAATTTSGKLCRYIIIIYVRQCIYIYM